jgi:hypothetical protein
MNPFTTLFHGLNFLLARHCVADLVRFIKCVNSVLETLSQPCLNLVKGW